MERGDFIKIQNIKGLVLGTMFMVGLFIPSVHTIKDNGVCESSATAGVFSATVVDLSETFPTVENTEVEVVAEPEPQWVEMDVPSNNSFKSYMGAHKITDTSSAQYQLKSEYLDSACGIKLVGDRYVIAIGTYYTETVGTRVDLVMENSSIVPCIVGDVKRDRDTDAMNRQHNVDGSVIEFVVNADTLSSEAKSHGDCSWADPRLMGEIKAIRVYKEN